MQKKYSFGRQIPNIPIYKYIKLRYLMRILTQKELLMNKVNSWDDIYENFLLKQTPIHDGVAANWYSNSDGIYGQSWTKRKSSDAMWRIYSYVPKNEQLDEIAEVGIRVQSTSAKLYDVVKANSPFKGIATIGSVKYMNDFKLYDWLDSNKIFGINKITDVMCESLFIKRETFSHEKEFRVIKVLDSSTKHPNMISFPIEPDSFFDEFVIEPRIHNQKIITIIKSLLECFSNVPVRQSRLYELTHNVPITIL